MANRPETETERIKKELEEKRNRGWENPEAKSIGERAEKRAQGNNPDAKDDKAGTEAAGTKTEKIKKPQKPGKVMGAGIPYLACGIVFIFLAFTTQIYKLGTLIFVALISWLTYFVLTKIRNRQVQKKEALEPKPEPKKEFSDDIAGKLDDLKNEVIDRAKNVTKGEVKEYLGSIAVTLGKMADEVEADPGDRNKVRKLANYYGDMILELIDKYIEFEKQTGVVIEGGNVDTGLANIEENLRAVDFNLKKTMDDMFAKDAMLVSADINTLEKLMHLENAGREDIPEEEPVEYVEAEIVEPAFAGEEPVEEPHVVEADAVNVTVEVEE